MTQPSLLDWEPYNGNGTPGYTSPGPSQEAAEVMAPKVEAIRAGIIECLTVNPAGLTADECAEIMGVHWQNVRPRMSEMKAAGKVEKTRLRRTNISNCSATVWRMA
jgi:hypothetical protein